MRPGRKAARDWRKKKFLKMEAMQRKAVVLRKELAKTLKKVRGTDSSAIFTVDIMIVLSLTQRGAFVRGWENQ